jgi:hypothetical protein
MLALVFTRVAQPDLLLLLLIPWPKPKEPAPFSLPADSLDPRLESLPF